LWRLRESIIDHTARRNRIEMGSPSGGVCYVDSFSSMSLPRGYKAKPVKPTAGTLEDPWRRLKRAETHLEALEREHGIWSALTSYRLRPEAHADGLEYRFYLDEAVPEVDPAVPFIVSEALFNLRSALDQLVYQLHVRRYRGRVPPDAERHAMFPILDTAELARRGKGARDPVKWNEIKRLGVRDRTAIKQFQPYITCNDDLAETRATLNVLAALNNIDKHRRLHVVRRIPAPVSKADQFPPGRAPKQTILFRDLVPGAYVERWEFPEPPDQMGVSHYCWPQVVIDEATLNLRVNLHDFLRQAFGHVCHVIERFNTRFGYEPWRNFRMF
jgi:hypothetical protein